MFREISKVMSRHYLVEFSAYRLGTRPAREQVGLYLPLLEKYCRDVVTARKKKAEF